MKEIYEKPELKINEFNSVDVMTASDVPAIPGDDNDKVFGE